MARRGNMEVRNGVRSVLAAHQSLRKRKMKKRLLACVTMGLLLAGCDASGVSSSEIDSAGVQTCGAAGTDVFTDFTVLQYQDLYQAADRFDNGKLYYLERGGDNIVANTQLGRNGYHAAQQGVIHSSSPERILKSRGRGDNSNRIGVRLPGPSYNVEICEISLAVDISRRQPSVVWNGGSEPQSFTWGISNWDPNLGHTTGYGIIGSAVRETLQFGIQDVGTVGATFGAASNIVSVLNSNNSMAVDGIGISLQGAVGSNDPYGWREIGGISVEVKYIYEI